MSKKEKKKEKKAAKKQTLYNSIISTYDNEEQDFIEEYNDLCKEERKADKKHKKRKKKYAKCTVIPDEVYRQCIEEDRYYEEISEKINNRKNEIREQQNKINKIKQTIAVVLSILAAVGTITLEILELMIQYNNAKAESTNCKKHRKHSSDPNPDKYRIRVVV